MSSGKLWQFCLSLNVLMHEMQTMPGQHHPFSTAEHMFLSNFNDTAMELTAKLISR